MKWRAYSLQPFFPEEALLPLTIGGSIAADGRLFCIRYVLKGQVDQVAIPAPAVIPTRRDRLWTETCLELFLARIQSQEYWEFNVSPSGDWNVYRFDAYRNGMREEDAFTSLPFDVRCGRDSLHVSMDFPLVRLAMDQECLEVGISAVIKRHDGRTSHWALMHAGSQPDFHRRESFSLTLP